MQEIDELIGDPDRLDRDLARFKQEAATYSRRKKQLVVQYANQWVAMMNGEVEVAGQTLTSVLSQLDAKRIQREHTLIRFLGKDEKTLIL